jgi:hypothetical protein
MGKGTTSHLDAQNSTDGQQVVRDSSAVLLEGHQLPKGDFIHLYDTTPYKIGTAMLLQSCRAIRVIQPM